MRKSSHCWPLVALVVGSAVVALVACSSSDGPSRAFDTEDDAGKASLPEAGSYDGGAAEAAPGVDPRPPFDPADEPVTCTATPCVKQVVAGENHLCARLDDGTVRCWGSREHGALGGGDSGKPTAVQRLEGVQSLAAGGSTTCALVAAGTIRCWGANDTGQLGLVADPPAFDDGDHPTPSDVALPKAAKALSVGPRSACATLEDGSIWCWGDNRQRLLARADASDVGGPAKAEFAGLDVTRLIAGTNTGFGVTGLGDLVTWGGVAGGEGVVAGRIASLSPDSSPLSIGLASVSSLGVTSTTFVPQHTWPPQPPKGVAHACAIAKGNVHCWGDNETGALGIGLPESVRKPTRAEVVSTKGWPQQVVAGGGITCVRLTDGTVQCAGDNARGVLGRGPEIMASMFFGAVPGFDAAHHAVQLAATSSSVCALLQGGNVVCWGGNSNHELGQAASDEDPHATPTPVIF
ncbi:hypothetical protein AKJ09_00116 [Labilithrix luteola]|uniref:BNR repeat domain protein n=1 Tax=Labilithrix luteola TaxID=1391654 RepID=A0A0K1PIV5_9BACT|nr:RCC1 domain-containing protein [Labilithrix luteola]AKU93452.1 hypothetical protein AKJ09_00116 [Labilithrix luteola]